MSLYTQVGTGLWTWEPFRRLERHHEDELGRCTKLFWLALYTTPEAKMVVPGMFVGSVTTMAESARMPVDAARRYLDRLLEDDLVEYDIEHRVLRMTQLPDAGESPRNGNAIRGWFRRFNGVPACSVRDAHPPLLRWVLDEWCRVNGKALSHDHANAWSETFGRLPMPTSRRKTPRHVQTDLFTASESADPKNNKLETYDRITGVIRDQDPDRDQDLSSQISEGGAGRPVLRLVPSTAFDADDLAEALAQATGNRFPRALTKPQRQALQRAIDAAAEQSAAPAVLDALRDYIAHGAPGLDPPRDTMTVEERASRSRGISPETVAGPGWLVAAIQRASEWAAKTAEQIAVYAEARKQLGFE